MDYAVHNVPSYQHLQGSVTPSHMGSKNSMAHLAGGDAGYKTSMGKASGGANEHDPGGYTEGAVGSGGSRHLG
jgi:hypothetical protein